MKFFKNKHFLKGSEAGEMSQVLGALASLADNMDSAPSTNTVAHNLLYSTSRNLTYSSDPLRCQAHARYTYAHAVKTPIRIKQGIHPKKHPSFQYPEPVVLRAGTSRQVLHTH